MSASLWQPHLLFVCLNLNVLAPVMWNGDHELAQLQHPVCHCLSICSPMFAFNV